MSRRWAVGFDVSIADLNRLRELFVTLFIQSFDASLGGTPPTRITLDLDARDDETHGQQPLQQQFAETSLPQREFVCWPHQAGSWSAPRCTIVKVEVNSEGTNRRTVLVELCTA